MDFEHFIITRFNVKVWWSNIENNIEWLETRFNLTKSFCFPSICHQTNSNFKWIVLFDPSTPSNIIDYFKSCKQFIPFTCKYFGIDIDDINHTKHVGKIYLEPSDNNFMSLIVNSPAEYIITTRLDNDDAISNDFVELVQNHFSKNTEVLNPTNGLIYRNGSFFRKKLYTSPFLSLVETKNNIRTAFGFPHWKANEFYNVKQIGDNCNWIQVVHNNNFVNNTLEIPSDYASNKEMCRFNIKQTVYNIL